MYQRNRSQTHHCHTHHQANLICQMIPITENPKERNAIQKKRRKHNKQDSSDSSSSDSDSSDESDYRHKQHKNKSQNKRDPIKLCAHLTDKLLTTGYK